jgi:hypothetical protein
MKNAVQNANNATDGCKSRVELVFEPIEKPTNVEMQ